MKADNIDSRVVESFGDEWSHFDQSQLGGEEYESLFNLYFSIFPWDALPQHAQGFDLGCGSGRWAKGVAPRVGKLHCIDASARALEVAKRNLGNMPNVEFHHASVDRIPLADGSMDFGYSLGVLHHVPNTQEGIASVASKLKPGAPLLLYLYYAFDNRGMLFRSVWKASDLVRAVVSRAPKFLRMTLSQIIALLIYFPLARLAWVLDALGIDVERLPLSAYRERSLYTMRTDALDRFGTRLEQRFTRAQIEAMMKSAGLENIRFSDSVPYWCAVGTRKR
jgi:SAM-dependent methyltransferase